MIPIDFNPKTYIELNEDLKDLTELQSKNHYENDIHLRLPYNAVFEIHYQL